VTSSRRLDCRSGAVVILTYSCSRLNTTTTYTTTSAYNGTYNSLWGFLAKARLAHQKRTFRKNRQQLTKDINGQEYNEKSGR
jgi:hypothetical protein